MYITLPTDKLPIKITSRAGVELFATASEDFPYGSLEILKGSLLKFGPSGLLESIDLQNDTAVNGIIYKGSTMLHLYTNMQVSSGTLAKDTLVKHKAIPYELEFKYRANTTVGFQENGQVSYGELLSAIEMGGPYFFYILPSSISFHKNGSIKSAFIRKNKVEEPFDINIDHGHAIIKTPYVELHEYTINPYDPISLVSFESVILSEETLWDKIPIQPGAPLRLYKTSENNYLGSLHSAFLGKDSIIGSFYLKRWAYIELYEDKKIMAISLHGLQKEHIIMGIKFQPGKGNINFYPNGIIKSFISDQKMVIQGITFPENTTVNFNSDGNVIIPSA